LKNRKKWFQTATATAAQRTTRAARHPAAHPHKQTAIALPFCEGTLGGIFGVRAKLKSDNLALSFEKGKD